MPRTFAVAINFKVRTNEDPSRQLMSFPYVTEQTCREGWLSDMWDLVDRRCSRLQGMGDSYVNTSYLLLNNNQLRVGVDGWIHLHSEAVIPPLQEIARIYRIKAKFSEHAMMQDAFTHADLDPSRSRSYRVDYVSKGPNAIGALWWAILINRIIATTDHWYGNVIPTSVAGILSGSDSSNREQFYTRSDREDMINLWDRHLSGKTIHVRKWANACGPFHAERVHADYRRSRDSRVRYVEQRHNLASILAPNL